jgi:tRNA pseudouridine32 synthase/23S rRNA pseudouridine746 synthase
VPDILYADQNFIILNKPAGLPVHQGPGKGRSVEDMFPLLSRRRTGPWLVHRLDADTAGCLVIALRRAALLAAQAEFAAHRAEKTYWAIVAGHPGAEAGTIDAPLTKLSTQAGWRMAIDPSGQEAVTDWRLLGHAQGESWLELRPRTGRTHQLRAHCLWLGCPILGDPIYATAAGGLQLLARSIALRLDPPLSARAPPPVHMRRALDRIGGKQAVLF